MKEPLAELAPRHAMALTQGCLFTMGLDEFEENTRVSADEMQRWQKRGYLSFDPQAVAQLDERHRIEVVFIAALVRSGLGDAWVERLLAGLRRPYCYNPAKTFYSFAHDRWITLPPAENPRDVIREQLAKLARDEDWISLRGLRDRIKDMLPAEESDDQE